MSWTGLAVATTVLLAGASAHSEPATVTGIALPSRNSGTGLAARAAHLASRLAARLGARVIAPAGPDAELGRVLRRARELLGRGAIDEAAQSLDLVVDGGLRAPDQIEDRTGFLDAVVIRIGIGLARAESDRTAVLVERLLRWDPDFTLRADEDSPALRTALERTRRRLGPRPALEPADVGQACHAADALIVVRALGPAVEITRLDGCQRVATTTARSDDEATLALAPAALAGSPPPTTPLVRRPWFWLVVGAVAIGSTAAWWELARNAGGYDVRTHL